MKILTSRSTDGTSLGGGEMSIRDHAIVLGRLGHDVVVVSNLDYLKQESREHGFRFIRGLWAYRDYGFLRLPYFLIVWPWMWIHYLLIALIEQPDLIYPHSRDDQVIFTLLKPIHRKKVVWRDPSDLRYFLVNQNPNIFARLHKWFLIKAIERADAIFTLTEEVQSMIIDNSGGVVGTDTVRHFPSNIFFENYNLDEPAKEKNGKFVIGCLLRLVEDKGTQFVITAFQEIAKSNKDIELWIVGDGDYRKTLENSTNSDPRIKFWGQQNNQSTFYNSFDIFVQPSLNEGWGKTIKEAMYFGVPIIGSRVGGIDLQIEEGVTGLKFTAGDSTDLQLKLEKLLSSPDLQKKLVKSAKKKTLDDGDFTAMFEVTIIPEFNKILGIK